MFGAAGSTRYHFRRAQVPVIFNDRFAFAADAINVLAGELLRNPVRVLSVAARAIKE